jgi:uncharacterized protein YraI
VHTEDFQSVIESGFESLSGNVSRRTLLGKVAAAAAVALTGGLAVAATALADASFMKTTSALNLRSGPGPRRRVLLVIPEATVVSYEGQSKNGYHKVGYQGTVGWAYADYLVDAGEGETEVPVPVGTTTTTDTVNFRNGPSTSASVYRVLPAGTTVDIFDVYENGFRMVGFAQVEGWIHTDFLASDNGGSEVPTPVGTARVNDSVNFRSGPSTSAKVIQVLPKNTRIDVFDVWENGFRMVGYAQVVGWVYGDYIGGQSGPLGGYVIATSAVNLREEANTSSRILAVIPEGGRAFRGDEIANNFLNVTYNGNNGWAYMDYLRNE